MHPAPDALLNQVVGGRWRVLEALPPTERGAVFRVEGLEDGRRTRLELWDARQIEGRGELGRFERKARVLSGIRHDRCLSLLAFGTHEGRPFLVSDLAEGHTLRDEIGKPELTVSRALALGLQICEGLRHLHGHGVVHRALRPENIWLVPSRPGELVKIGLPRIGGPDERLEAARERLYQPPELSRSRPDERADLYALGMLLYVMCTGREPAMEGGAAPSGRTIPAPRALSPDRGISERLERVILRAVAPSPDVRFRTAEELVAALEDAGAQPVAAKPRPALTARARPALIAAALAAAGVLGTATLRLGDGPTPSVSPAEPVVDLPTAAAEPAVEPPLAPRAPITSPPVEPAREVAPVAAPKQAAPARTTGAGSVSSSEQNEIWSLLDSGRLDEAAVRIRQLLAKDPEAAWPRFALGVLHYRRYWRRDCIKQWELALAKDPQIRNDPQFGAYLCFMLDEAWQAAGSSALLNRLGAEAVPLLDQCVASAKSPRLRAQAARALDQVRRADGRSSR